MKKNEKMSVSKRCWLLYIVQGIVWIVFAITGLFPLPEVLSSIIVTAVLLWQIILDGYMGKKKKEKTRDEFDEMAKAHDLSSTQTAASVVVLSLLILAIADTLAEMILGTPIKLGAFTFSVFFIGLLNLVKGIAFVKLEKEGM